MRPTVKTLDTVQELSRVMARDILQAALRSIAARGCFRLALSGGQSPRELYRQLAAMEDFPWNATTVCLVDERLVPRDSPDHNGRMIEEILGPQPGQLLLVETEGPWDTETRVRDYMEKIKEFLPLDLAVLGMGADGHTASLFPDTPQWACRQTTVLSCSPGQAPHRRISLSLPVLEATETLMFLVSGGSKAARLEEILETQGDHGPVSSLLASRLTEPAQAGRTVFYLDREAGSLLS